MYNRPLEVEGFHFYLSSVFDKHQDLWSFTERLRKLHAHSMAFEEQVCNGHTHLKLRKPVYRQNEVALAQMRAQYVGGNMYDGDLNYVLAVHTTWLVFE